MKSLKSFRFTAALLVVFLLAVPATVTAQDNKAPAAKRFSQQELDQMLAPIALYPDSLLAHVLMASTYPLEVVMADRWVKQNKSISGDRLKEAAEKQPWDPSVKALVTFPDLLSTMAEKLDWTEKLGDAFLAQQADVMETVQNLRKKAYEAGNLKSTDEQHVIVEKEIIRVEPADPRVVYVPIYDPWWVYGPWWWPYYPPYVVYPYPYYGAVFYPGYIGFSVGFSLGAYWGHWGYWNWPYRQVYVNPYYYGRRYPGYRRPPVGNTIGFAGAAYSGRSPASPPSGSGSIGSFGNSSGMQQWTHDPYHRRGVAYTDPAVRNRFGQVGRTTADNRRVSRVFEDNMARRTAAARADAGTRAGTFNTVGRTAPRSYGSPDRQGIPDGTAYRTRPDRSGIDRRVGVFDTGRSSTAAERSGRIDPSSTAGKALDQRTANRQAPERAYRPYHNQGRAFPAPEGVNRGIRVPQAGNPGRGQGVPAAKAPNWTGVLGGQSGGAALPGGSIGSGSGRMGGWGGNAGSVPRGGSFGHGGGMGVWGGGGFRGGGR